MWLLTVFDPESEVTSFLAEVIEVGWPIFLAITGGLVAVTLAAFGIVAVFRRVVSLLGGGPSFTRMSYADQKAAVDEAFANADDFSFDDLGARVRWQRSQSGQVPF